VKKISFHNRFSHDLFPFTQFSGFDTMVMSCIFVIALKNVELITKKCDFSPTKMLGLNLHVSGNVDYNLVTSQI
jgi:hypothetical protein